MAASERLELWGGLECTMARIGDRFRDLIAETGHRDRSEDLGQVAALGIRTLRYPVLLETISPTDPERADWTWHDQRLGRIRALGMRPIAGLVHHGSGPRYTDLLDPAFPNLVARHAERVARRYPWIDLYTPINEPLTTARFSALYGHWYPHCRDDASFLRAFVNQCRAVALSMQAIRRVNPDARLVQTDDLGRTFSTPRLAYQAEYDNGRRWLTFDLLFGRVDQTHPWWTILRDHGIAEGELSAFLDGGAAPDILGINHYLTSDRFLDERLASYPQATWGGNGRDRYADAEAVRVRLPDEELGPAARLREAWARYGTPLAITEVHHGCTRDEQLRWLAEIWDAALKVQREGADIRAVTIWSLFGAVDWNTLLTRENGIYEPGVFDARAVPPRPTALAGAARSLATVGAFEHPVLDTPGWWRREERFYRPSAAASASRMTSADPRPLLAVGPEGALSRELVRIAAIRGLRLVHPASPGRPAAAAIRLSSAWAVISVRSPRRLLGGVDPSGPIGAPSLEEDGAAEACGDASIPFLAFSTDLVFDGRLGRALTERDPTSALDPVGQAAAARETRLQTLCPPTLICRTGPLFGPGMHERAPADLFAAPRERGPAPAERVSTTYLVSPTYLPDALHVALDLLIDGAAGIWHLANPGASEGRDVAAEIRGRVGLDPAPAAAGAADPGSDRVLDTCRGLLMPPLDSALDRFVQDSGLGWHSPSVAAE